MNYFTNSLSNNSFLGVFILFVVLLVFSSNVVSEEGELSLKQMLLSPGDLTKSHAEIESKCTECHVHFDKTNQTPLCLNCHEIIQDDIKGESGFHGRLLDSQKSNCKSCHTDHKGRESDITGLDTEYFDHSKTNFALDGVHKNLDCSSCHVGGNVNATNMPDGILVMPVGDAFRFKEYQCSSCHFDFHDEKLGDQCQDCHTTSAFTDSKFDHSKTDFKLLGKHKDLICSSCHINNKFEAVDAQCSSCHLSKDSHLGIFGKECSDCHTSKEWLNNQYDHFAETGYQLKDSHVELKGVSVKCIDCHSEKLNPQTKCIGCHQQDDIHQGGNGNQCQDCHNQKSWNKTDFIHDMRSTGFILTGEHKNVSCDSCHTPGEKRKKNYRSSGLGLVRGCIDCHQVDDPHFGKLGKDCGSCHQTENWQDSVRFNHDFTDFPLTASHQLLVCESCHLSSDFSQQTKDCVNCHLQDDIHQESLGNKCETCHDSSVWTHWVFDHGTDTKFLLNGSHQNLQCELCHNSQQHEPLKPAKDCYSCHRNDDIHNGGFGVDCQQCHTESRFDELSF